MLRPAQYRRERDQDGDREGLKESFLCSALWQQPPRGVYVCADVEPEGDRVTPQVPGEQLWPKGCRQAEQHQSICTIDFSHTAASLIGGA